MFYHTIFFVYIIWVSIAFCYLHVLALIENFTAWSILWLIFTFLRCLAKILLWPLKNIFTIFSKYRVCGTLGRAWLFHKNSTFFNASLKFLRFRKKPFLLCFSNVFYHIAFLMYYIEYYSTFIKLHMLLEYFTVLHFQ